MKILRVMGKLDRGGAETGFVRLLQKLDRKRYQTDVLVHTSQPGALDEVVRALGVRIIPCLDVANLPRYSWNLSQVIRQFGPYDVVHSSVHLYSGCILPVAFAHGVPLRIVHAHTSGNGAPGCVARAMYIRTMRKAIQVFATAGLAVSEEAATALFPKGWRKSERWRIIHSGIDLNQFRVQVDGRKLRQDLGLGSARWVVGHVGRFDDCKNHSFFVEVAGEVLKHNPETMFLLVGKGPRASQIDTLVRRLGIADKFVFAGVRDDVAKLMLGAMDCLLFPSRFEGLPTTILEAQTAGLPCVISDVITDECDVMSGLITRVSLSQPAAYWAKKVNAALTPQRTDNLTCCAAMKDWSAEEAARRLVAFYDECASTSR